LQLANLRRTAPAETARKYEDQFAKRTAESDARIRADEEARLAAAQATMVDVGIVERVDEMQQSWQKASSDLAGLKTGLGSSVARMEKAQKAAEVIEEK
jgi:kinetochor protein Mis14/NSL1